MEPETRTEFLVRVYNVLLLAAIVLFLIWAQGS